jgi:hypothetical protein
MPQGRPGALPLAFYRLLDVASLTELATRLRFVPVLQPVSLLVIRLEATTGIEPV